MLLRKATSITLFILLMCSPSAQAAISFIAGYTANSNSVGISAPNANDIILVCAGSGSTTVPSLATGFTSLFTNAAPNSTTLGTRCGWKYSNGTETSSGAWANANGVEVAVYRGVNLVTPFGANTASNDVASTTTLTYPTFSLTVGDGTSWVVTYGRAGGSTDISTPPSGLTARAVRSNNARVIADTNAGVSSWSDHTQTVSSTATAGASFELLLPSSTVIHLGPHVH